MADATAWFALSEVKVGLVAGAGSLDRLPRAVPSKLANEMIFTGRRLTADDALACGLVNREDATADMTAFAERRPPRGRNC